MMMTVLFDIIMRMIVSKRERSVLRHEAEVIATIECRKALAAVLTAEQVDEHRHAKHPRVVDGSRVAGDRRVEAIDNAEGGRFFLGIISVSGESARKYINLNAFAALQLRQQHRPFARDVLGHRAFPASLLQTPKINVVSLVQLPDFSL